MKDEAVTARDQGKLIPISLDGAPPPIGFRQYHAIDFTDEGAALDDLKRSLEAKMASSAEQPAAENAGAGLASPRVAALADKKLLIGAIAAALVCIVAVLLFFFGSALRPHPEAPTFEETIAGIASETAAAAPAKSIAVLPFVDMSEAGDQEYFSDGVSEEILNALAGLPDLQVAGRTSSFAFKGRNIDIREIGAALNVANILEGSVRKQGDRVRITAQLIRASDGYHLWSEAYDGTLDDIFDLQEKISRAIAGKLEIILQSGGQKRLAQKLTGSQEAYDLFLQGRELTYRVWGEDTLPKAVDYLKQAVEIDPDFLDAWDVLSLAYYMLPQYVVVDDEAPYLAEAERAARRALEIDPDSYKPLIRLGSLYIGKKQYLKGYELHREALEKAGADRFPGFITAYDLAALGYTHESLAVYDAAVAKDPATGVLLLSAAVAEFNAGNYEKAEKLARRSYDLGFYGAAFTVADILDARGDAKAAMDFLDAAYDNVMAFSTQFTSPVEWNVMKSAIYGRNPVAREAVRRTLQAQLNKDNPKISTVTLGLAQYLGEPELFMKTFEKYDFANSAYALSRIWDDREVSRKIRRRPDFPGFAERIGLADVWRKYGWPDKCRPLPGTDGSNGRFECD